MTLVSQHPEDNGTQHTDTTPLYPIKTGVFDLRSLTD